MVSATSFDPGAFSAFEHAGWQRVANQYNNSFASLTAQAAEALLETNDVREGMEFLDIATGPGDVAANAAQKGAHAVGVDFSEAMLAGARQRHPHIEFREGNAEALPFDDNFFDAITINFGLLHFGRPELALREARRVLRPGTKISFTVWTPPEEAVGFGIILQAVADHGTWQNSVPAAPYAFHFSDKQECPRTLLALGFVAPTVTHLPLDWELPSSDAFFRAMDEGTVRTGSLLRAQSRESLAAIRRAVELAVRVYEKDGKIVLPMPAVLVSALKP